MIYRISLFAINFISPFNASFKIAFTNSCASIAMIIFSFLYSYSYLISLILIFPHRVFENNIRIRIFGKFFFYFFKCSYYSSIRIYNVFINKF